MPSDIAYALDRAPTPHQLKHLFAHTGWAAERTIPGIARQIAATEVHATAWADGQLVAYARALTDGVYRALIDDVVVDPALRRAGVGQGLLRALVGHLGGVEEIHLICDNKVKPFYQSLGFTDDHEENLMYHPRP